LGINVLDEPIGSIFSVELSQIGNVFKIEIIYSSETLESIYWTRRCHHTIIRIFNAMKASVLCTDNDQLARRDRRDRRDRAPQSKFIYACASSERSESCHLFSYVFNRSTSAIYFAT
jgi:hypothetical protein